MTFCARGPDEVRPTPRCVRAECRASCFLLWGRPPAGLSHKNRLWEASAAARDDGRVGQLLRTHISWFLLRHMPLKRSLQLFGLHWSWAPGMKAEVRFVGTKGRRVFERAGDQSLSWGRGDGVVGQPAAGVFSAVCPSLRLGTPGQRGHCPKGAPRSLSRVPASDEDGPRTSKERHSPKGHHLNIMPLHSQLSYCLCL